MHQRLRFLSGLLLLAFGSTGVFGQAANWRDAQRHDAEWYATDEAARIAANVRFCQHDNGGWHKNFDYTRRLNDADRARLIEARDKSSTIDNGATTMEMIYLARVFQATGQQRYREAFLRGFDYLIEMQYDNGGWPQYYPLIGGYHDAITYNDDAMIRVMNLLRDVARREPLYRFVDEARRVEARAAVDKGIRCILDTQIIVDGRRTAWCAQHDEATFEPTRGRAFEPPSISGAESVPIVEFLMGIGEPSPRVIEAVQSAVRWFDQTKLTGIKVVRFQNDGQSDRKVVQSDAANPRWARFYEIGTNRPIFAGHDGVVKYRMAEIERERRGNYSWYSGRARALLDEYPAWQKRFAPDANVLAKR